MKMFSFAEWLFAMLWLIPCGIVSADQGEDVLPSPSVGQARTVSDVFIPGERIVASRKRDRRAPVVVRIVRDHPLRNGFEYDIEYYGLEPGPHDLAKYLEFSDGSTQASIPSIPVHVSSELPSEHPLEMQGIVMHNASGFRLYIWLTRVLVVIWIIGLVAILSYRTKRDSHAASTTSHRTARDELQSKLEQVHNQELTIQDKVEIERLVYIVLCQRYVAGMDMSEAVLHLRHLPETRTLLLELEHWLHAPGNEAFDLDSMFVTLSSLTISKDHDESDGDYLTHAKAGGSE
ncbi:hypothetical protein DTL21_06570 [Bremerella cremea]|uniref:Uncharacterized protein n=1 Tax=Blastopirellula marina TaxID=124 RepID=A0A2S8G0D1_9BACT|nr:hypothetical protein C5Y83_06570 [Blastopirellula marina]RCS49991.1 hypothetical protein DTL21_06570 [Bremerella cremea]